MISAAAMALSLLSAMPAGAEAPRTVSVPQIPTASNSAAVGRLENGLGFVVLRRCGTDANAPVEINLDVAAGSYQDPPKMAEIAHITEHVMSYLRDEKGEVVIERWRPAIYNGYTANASTDAQNTRYWFHVPSSQVKDVLSYVERIFNSNLITRRDVEIHKKLVVAEGFSGPDERAQKLLNRAQGAGPYSFGLPREDLIRDVPRVTRADIVRFHKRNYRPENAILSIKGCVEVQPTANEIGRRFAKLKNPPANRARKLSAFTNPASEPSFVEAIDPDAKKALIMVSLAPRGMPGLAPQEIVANAAAHNILHNRLQILRAEKRLLFPGELVLLPGTGFDATRRGAWAVRAEVAPGSVAAAVEDVLRVLVNARSASPDEIDRAQEAIGRTEPGNTELDEHIARLRGGTGGSQAPSGGSLGGAASTTGDEAVRRELWRLTDIDEAAIGYYSHSRELSAEWLANVKKTIALSIADDVEKSSLDRSEAKKFQYSMSSNGLSLSEIESIIYLSHLIQRYNEYARDGKCKVDRISFGGIGRSIDLISILSKDDIAEIGNIEKPLRSCVSNIQNDEIFKDRFANILHSDISNPKEVFGGEQSFYNFSKDYYVYSGNIINLSGLEESKLLSGQVRFVDAAISRLQANYDAAQRSAATPSAVDLSPQVSLCPSHMRVYKRVIFLDDEPRVSNVKLIFWIRDTEKLEDKSEKFQRHVSVIYAEILKRLRAERGLVYSV